MGGLLLPRDRRGGQHRLAADGDGQAAGAWLGVALAAIRIQSGSLWPVLAVHVVIDLVAVATLTGPSTASPILLPVLFGGLGANLLLWRYGWRLLRADAAPREAISVSSTAVA